MRRRHRSHRWIAWLCAGTAAAALTVAAVLGHDASDAQRELPTALQRIALQEPVSTAAREALTQAQRLARRAHYGQAAEQLELLARLNPAVPVHEAAALSYRAATDPTRGARHALSAARLLDSDAQAQKRADAALDIATLSTAREPLRIAGGVALGGLLLLGARAALGRRRRRQIERYVGSLSGDLRVQVEGVAAPDKAQIAPWHEHVALDLFLRGRHGMARPRPPHHGPTLRMRLSNARAGRTVRLARVPNLRDSAARLRLSPEALAALRESPGSWRATAVLGDRIVALCDLEVAPAPALRVLSPHA